jgi:hypothetical protein
MDERGTPLDQLCIGTPSARKLTLPASYSIAYSWKSAVGSNGSCFVTVFVCPPAE